MVRKLKLRIQISLGRHSKNWRENHEAGVRGGPSKFQKVKPHFPGVESFGRWRGIGRHERFMRRRELWEEKKKK